MNIKFGCAPINWTNDDLPELGGELTYQQCLSEMALAGYTGSEGGTKFPKDATTLGKALDLRGLSLCNMWFSSFLSTFENERTFAAFDRHLDFTHGLGASVVGVGECGVTVHGQESVPLFPACPKLSESQWSNLAKGLDEMGRRAKARGMTLCFHPHVGTGIQSRGEVEKLMAMTDPDLVRLLFDTGHITLAGDDPVAILKKYLGRIGHIHFKDVRRKVFETFKNEGWSFLHGVKEGMFTVPGDGDMVDWKAIFDLLRGSSYDGWIVVEAEQDPAKADPLEYAMKARRFMRENLGA
jgi:inosose dehydratase